MEEKASNEWEILKDMQQIHADGIFFCKNPNGEKVVLLYSKENGIFMTCSVGECDHGLPFSEKH